MAKNRSARGGSGNVLRFGTITEYESWLANRSHLVAPKPATQAKQTEEPRRTKPLVVKIPMRSESLNTIYSADHWSVRQKLAADVHEQVAWQLRLDNVERVPFAPRVDVHVDAYFCGKHLDSDNIATKLLIDGARQYGILTNDDPRYVRRVSSESHASETGREWIVITFTHIKEK